MIERGPTGDWPPNRRDFERDLEPERDHREREELIDLAVELTESRPVPSPRLRSAIRSALLGDDSPVGASRVGALIFGYAASGALLLIVAAAGLVGIGPFAS